MPSEPDASLGTLTPQFNPLRALPRADATPTPCCPQAAAARTRHPPSVCTRAAIGSGAGPTRMMRPEGPARRPSLTQMPDARCRFSVNQPNTTH
ncbi:hypothetical protein J3F83DRAFT_739984, partial [Trichoderma novae-zelandiae]